MIKAIQLKCAVFVSSTLKEEHTENRHKGSKWMAKKYYVVWSGNQTGIFTSWEECKQQVHGFQGAKYKSYQTKKQAELAFQKGYKDAMKKTNETTKAKQMLDDSYIKDSLSVDAACSGNPGEMEYQGVHTESGEQLFYYGPVPKGTNNIGEFLAIVHALAYLKETNRKIPIYSDSLTAISWVRNKRANTSLIQDESTKKIWNVIGRAEKWLQEHTYSNQVLKWETHLWGESKADFGRK